MPSNAHLVIATPGQRDQVLDGFRGLAVAGVLFGHAVNYRYAGAIEAFGQPGQLLTRLAGPLADGGVSLFFAISGFIITTLLLSEEARGGISIAQFFIRRAFRILPAFLLFLVTLWLLAQSGWIRLPSRDISNAALFTCNTGLTGCSWFVAHTWSLAVEEQFYLTWPVLLAFAPPGWRRPGIYGTIVMLITAHVLLPFAWHGNPVSFACIAAGAACSLEPRLRDRIERWGSPLSVALALAIALAGPSMLPGKLFQALLPFLAVFVLFGSRRITLANFLLGSRPFQALGSMSYGLYLWQQLFLGPPELYADGLPQTWVLPVVTAVSLLAVERPLIRLGHRLSIAVKGRRQMPIGENEASLPAAASLRQK